MGEEGPSELAGPQLMQAQHRPIDGRHQGFLLFQPSTAAGSSPCPSTYWGK